MVPSGLIDICGNELKQAAGTGLLNKLPHKRVLAVDQIVK
jgi:hypothetical protein